MKREIFLSVTLLAACGLIASSPACAANGTGGLQLAWGDGYGESNSKSAGYGGGQQKDDSWEQPKKKTYEDDEDDYRPPKKKKKTYEDEEDYQPKKKGKYETDDGYGGKADRGEDASESEPEPKPRPRPRPRPRPKPVPQPDTTKPDKPKPGTGDPITNPDSNVPGADNRCKPLCEAECKVRFNSKVTDQPTAETKKCLAACPKKCAGK